MPKLFCLLLTLLVLLAACTEDSDDPSISHTIVATDYEQSCQSDDECMVITEGDYCSCLGCPNAAINVVDRVVYRSDSQAAANCPNGRPNCGALEQSRTRQQAAGACHETEAMCVQGTCEIIRIDTVEETVDRSCDEDADCVIAPRELCGDCSCPTAVSQAGYDLAVRLRERIGCDDVAEMSCACGEVAPPECREGTCYAASGESGCERTTWESATCE